MQGGRGQWTVNYTGTQCFITSFSYWLALKKNGYFGKIPHFLTNSFVILLSSLGMYIDLLSIVLSPKIPDLNPRPREKVYSSKQSEIFLQGLI